MPFRVDAANDDRITAFLAWRRRRALEAGLFRPEQLLDEWVFRRILLHAPQDVYELEKLKLLTGPLQHQYGADLLALSRGRPTEDERPQRHRIERDDDDDRPLHSRRPADRARRTESAAPRHHGVRADDPPVNLPSVRADRKTIADFESGPDREGWRGREFEFRCSTLSFKFWETEFLETWGALLEALAAGSESPTSPDEESASPLAARSRKAAKEWEQAWVKLVLRRSYESA